MDSLTPELSKFLDANRVGVLATLAPAGRPRQSLVYFVRDGERLVVSTLADRLKARDVRRSGWASLCVMGHEPPYPSATFSGPAEILTREIGPATAKLAQRITGAAEPPQAMSDEALAEVGRVLHEITIERVTAVSHIPAPTEEHEASRMTSPPHRIDVHAHYLAPVYIEALQAADRSLIGGIPIPEWTPELALAFMDRFGIERQFLSVSDPGAEFVAASDRAALASACNDFAAAVVRAHSGRFGAFALLPGQPAEALAEASRALDELGLDGVGLLSSYRGRYLGDAAFEPLLAALNARKAWVFVHPTAVPADSKPASVLPDFIAEYPFDTTRAIISLLINGSFERHRGIRWHFAHGGGTVPMLRARLNALAAAIGQLGPVLGAPEGSRLLSADSARNALRRAYFDTALVADQPALLALEAMAGPERIVFGSDWPFAARLYGDAPDGDPQPALHRTFPTAFVMAIERSNAERELGIRGIAVRPFHETARGDEQRQS